MMTFVIIAMITLKVKAVSSNTHDNMTTKMPCVYAEATMCSLYHKTLAKA